MRLTQIIFGARTPVPEKKIPFRSMRPLAIGNKLERNLNMGPENTCIHEMTLLLSCLAENEYNNGLCAEELKVFRKCTEIAVKKAKARKQFQDDPIPGQKLSTRQINKLLEKYPHT